MRRDKVQVYRGVEKGTAGWGVRVVGEGASLADLLEVWEPLSDDPEAVKIYAGGSSSCKGCIHNCCNSAYVIPDLISFKAICRKTGFSTAEALENCFDPASMEAGMLRWRYGPCLFLEHRLCQVYEERSLICRFYLCTDLLGDTEELVYSIVAAGMAALYIWLERQDITVSGKGLTGYDRTMLEVIDNYRSHPGTREFLSAGSYGDIDLRAFI